ncbi:MAG: class I SAM-dependent methyltransferase [Chloroflexota bacterium]
MTDSEYWARYYAVTVDRPAWATVRSAIERFVADDGDTPRDRHAVDLGCGAGRDTRELLRAGWRVLAIDREPGAIAALEAATPDEWRARLETGIADMASVSVPPCDLVNASLSLPFMARDEFWATWARILAALPVGGRVSAMLFGDRDASADDPGMTCPSPEAIRGSLSDFAIEDWVDREEDSETALGEPHHFHRVELVARRVHSR